MDAVAATFPPGLFAVRPIFAAVGFSANIKGCYVASPEQVWTCICARCAAAEAIFRRGVSQTHSPIVRVRVVPSESQPCGELECRAITLRQNTQACSQHHNLKTQYKASNGTIN